MKNTPIYVFVALLAIFIMISGCTSPAGDGAGSQKVQETKEQVQKTTKDQAQDASSEVGKTNSSSSVISQGSTAASGKAGNNDNFYSIRIVPASVLDSLQKKMGPDEFLVHNEKGETIGIVSDEVLIIRGDLARLERDSGSSGKEFDKTDVSEHLIDITFGLDNSKVSLFKTNKDYKFWFDAYYTTEDVEYVKELARKLNSISGTTQFEDEEVELGFLQTNYEDIPYNFYNIKLITNKMMKDYFDDRKDTDHLIKNKNGELVGIVNLDSLYLLKDLSDKEQKYYILKGLLYSMGLHGVSYKNADSFFFRNEGANLQMSDLDIEAIRLLYGGGLKSGLTMEETKKTLGLAT